MYEISILVRNAQGDVVTDKDGNAKRKLFKADTGYKLWESWNRNTFHRPKKKNKSRAALPHEVKQAVSDINEFAEKVAEKKRGSNGNDKDVQAL